MGLPLIDGVFLSIVLTGGLSSFADSILVGSFVLGGGATVGIILSEFDNSLRTSLIRTLLISVLIGIVAVSQAAVAPFIEPYLNTDRFMIGAILALVLLSVKVLPINTDYIPINPGHIILVTLLLSLNLTPVPNGASINGTEAWLALVATVIATLISIVTILLRQHIVAYIKPEALKYATSAGLFGIALNISGIVPGVIPVILFLGVCVVLSIYMSINKSTSYDNSENNVKSENYNLNKSD